MIVVSNDLHIFQDPMDPREALYGGGMLLLPALLEKLQGNRYWQPRPAYRDLFKKYHMKYKDFTSLYRFINKNGIYPVGHPVMLHNVNLRKLCLGAVSD